MTYPDPRLEVGAPANASVISDIEAEVGPPANIPAPVNPIDEVGEPANKTQLDYLRDLTMGAVKKGTEQGLRKASKNAESEIKDTHKSLGLIDKINKISMNPTSPIPLREEIQKQSEDNPMALIAPPVSGLPSYKIDIGKPLEQPAKPVFEDPQKPKIFPSHWDDSKSAWNILMTVLNTPLRAVSGALQGGLQAEKDVEEYNKNNPNDHGTIKGIYESAKVGLPTIAKTTWNSIINKEPTTMIDPVLEITSKIPAFRQLPEDSRHVINAILGTLGDFIVLGKTTPSFVSKPIGPKIAERLVKVAEQSGKTVGEAERAAFTTLAADIAAKPTVPEQISAAFESVANVTKDPELTRQFTQKIMNELGVKLPAEGPAQALPIGATYTGPRVLGDVANVISSGEGTPPGMQAAVRPATGMQAAKNAVIPAKRFEMNKALGEQDTQVALARDAQASLAELDRARIQEGLMPEIKTTSPQFSPKLLAEVGPPISKEKPIDIPALKQTINEMITAEKNPIESRIIRAEDRIKKPEIKNPSPIESPPENLLPPKVLSPKDLEDLKKRQESLHKEMNTPEELPPDIEKVLEKNKDYMQKLESRYGPMPPRTPSRTPPEIRHPQPSPELLAKERGFTVIARKMGKSEEDIRKGFQYSPGEQGVKEEAILGAYDKEMKDFVKQEHQLGIPVNEIENYVMRSRTPESQKLFKKLFGKKQGDTQVSKHRAGVEEGISLAGTEGADFFTKLSDTYAKRAQVNAFLTSAATREKILMEGYGKAIKNPGDLSIAEKQAAVDQGLTIYKPKYWEKELNKSYLVDKKISQHLDYKLGPKSEGQLNQIVNTYDNWMRKWDRSATTARLGFAFRNIVFGNSLQYWEHGGQLKPLWAAVKMDRYARKQVPIPELNKMGPKEQSFGGKTFKRWDEEFKRQGVLSGGISQTDLSKSTRQGRGWSLINPASRNFVVDKTVASINDHGEKLFRRAIFITKRMEGYSEQEAGQWVADTHFNYDEMSPFMTSVAKRTLRFITWPYKAVAQQAKIAIRNPAKLSKTQALISGYENMGPPTDEETRLEQLMPEKEHRGMIRRPFARGPQGERQYVGLTGLLPGHTGINLMDPRKGRLVSSLKSLVSWPIKTLAGEISDEGEQPGLAPRSFSQPIGTPEQFRNTPDWVDGGMEVLRKKYPDLWKQAVKIFPPQSDITERTEQMGAAAKRGEKDLAAAADISTKPLRYKVSDSAMQILGSVFPKAATYWRLGIPSKEYAYGPLMSFLTGIKSYGWTKEKARREWENALDKFEKGLKDKEATQKKLGNILPQIK